MRDTEEKLITTATPPRPRLSCRIINTQQLITPPANIAVVPSKMEDTTVKKIRILEIQLEAANLENNRLKQHINLLRNNHQKLRRVAVTELTSIEINLLQPEHLSQEERKCLEEDGNHLRK